MRHEKRSRSWAVAMVAAVLAAACVSGTVLAAEKAAPPAGGAATRPTAGAAQTVKDPVLGALPEEPLMVLRVDSLTGLSEALGRTRLGQHVKASPLLSSWFDLCRDLFRFATAILTDFPEETLARLLSRQAALVVFERPAEAAGPVCFAFAVDLGEDARTVQEAFKQQVARRLEALNPQVAVSDLSVNGVPLTVLKDGPKETYVRFAGGLLLMGTKEAVLRFKPGSGGPAWLAGAQKPAGIAWAHVNLQPLWDQAMRRQSPGDRQGLEASGLLAVTGVSGQTVVEDGGFRDTVVLSLRQDGGGVLPAVMGLKAGEARCASVVPSSYAFLASLQIESGERLYGLIEEVIRQTQGEAGLQRLRTGMGQVDRVFAINVEWELLPRIGREVFFACRALDADVLAAGRPAQRADFAPFFGFAVNDAAALRELFERFAASPQAAQMGWQFYTEGHEGQEVHVLRNIAGPAGLSLAFLGDFLVCSQDTETVKSVVSAFVAGKTMANDPQYQGVAKHLPPEGQAMVYADTRPIKPLLSAAMKAKAPPKAQAILPLIERAVPDLGGYGMAVVTEGGQIRGEGYGDVPALFAMFSFMSLGGAVESQKPAPQPGAAQPAVEPPPL